MHVLHVYKDAPPVMGGIENHLWTLATAQARRGLRVTVLVTNPRGATTVTREPAGDGATIEVIRTRRLATLASTPLSPALVARLARIRPDVTHLQLPYPMAVVGRLLVDALPGRRRTPLVVSYQSDIVRQRALMPLYGPIQRRLLARADRILVSSDPYRRSARPLAPHADRCAVVPLGIDPAPLHAPDSARVADWHKRFPGPRV
ncbi:MAG: glycosyltransferase, partial [Acidobacteriota bacterium]